MYGHSVAKDLFLSLNGVVLLEECRKRHSEETRIQECVQAILTVLAP